MIIAKKRNGLIIIKYVVIGCIMIQLFSAFRVNAAESKVYELPISYFNQYSSAACDDNESIKKQTNIVLTATTDKLQKGTRLIISGIPNDSIYFQEDDNYTVVISEGNAISTIYGGWYDGIDYEDGTIEYTVQTDEASLELSFGDWQTKFSSGRDACFLIDANGNIEAK